MENVACGVEKLVSEVAGAVKGVGGKVIDAVVSIDRVTTPVYI